MIMAMTTNNFSDARLLKDIEYLLVVLKADSLHPVRANTNHWVMYDHNRVFLLTDLLSQVSDTAIVNSARAERVLSINRFLT